jgi:hypothetical protein
LIDNKALGVTQRRNDSQGSSIHSNAPLGNPQNSIKEQAKYWQGQVNPSEGANKLPGRYYFLANGIPMAETD